MNSSNTKRIAMWSGPRNISTAMMRSWGSRADTVVCDEPLYAHYLLQTGVPHPGAPEVVAHHEADWRKVVTWLTGPPPQPDSASGARPAIWYQKHMAHHLLPEIERDWLHHLTHAFLIRDPREMLTSLMKNVPNPTIRDTGLVQQVEIFEHVERATGRTPPVIDSRDVLQDPRRMLMMLCTALDVPFDKAMLHWAPGPRPTDGIWAKHWYASVERSTTFEPYMPKAEQVPASLQSLLDECQQHYQHLYDRRLR
ncbi:MAG TPA: hypothetical protein VMS30_08460 [Phycisphaerales bacterium]|nr:hypothetical protein [Phycisphaerales bacterium]